MFTESRRRRQAGRKRNMKAQDLPSREPMKEIIYALNIKDVHMT
jgi:hypothetical protein